LTTFAEVEAMRRGARNAVRVCMNTRSEDRVAIIGDRQSYSIARLLLEEAFNVGARAEVFTLETFGRRPLRELPAKLVKSLRAMRPTVTFFTAAAEEGEITFRMKLLRLLTQDLKARHGHMVGITPQIMREGMAADYRKVERVTRAVYEIVRRCTEIRAVSPDGTDLVARFSPHLRWIPSTGIYHQPGQWGNLPDGEVFTCPVVVNGTLAARVAGDFFSERYGYLDEPLIVTVEEGRLVDATGPSPLAREFLEYVRSVENGDRVGEFAIGTNVGLQRIIGNLLQDEKFPGVHIAFGNPYPHETGADWASAIHVDVVSPHTTVWVDGDLIMENGKFNFDVVQLD